MLRGKEVVIAAKDFGSGWMPGGSNCSLGEDQVSARRTQMGRTLQVQGFTSSTFDPPGPCIEFVDPFRQHASTFIGSEAHMYQSETAISK